MAPAKPEKPRRQLLKLFFKQLEIDLPLINKEDLAALVAKSDKTLRI
jgi:hypothetical protein